MNAVDPVLLEADAFSTKMLQAYNSINVHVNVSIDNKANQPDLGNVARTNHNRLTSRSVADGFNVVSLALQAFLFWSACQPQLANFALQAFLFWFGC